MQVCTVLVIWGMELVIFLVCGVYKLGVSAGAKTVETCECPV